MTVNRRSFLKGAAAGAAGTALTGGLLAGVRADARRRGHRPRGQDAYPFHGTHQAGILRPRPATSSPPPASPRSTSPPTARPGWPS